VAILRALLFDFGGTLDCPIHWLDRFLSHYRACGLAIERAELDPAFSRATAQAYRAAGTIRRIGLREIGLRETVDFLLRAQIDYLSCLGPEHLGERFQQMGPAGVADLRNRIGAAFAEESLRGMKRSRKLIVALKRRFGLGVVSNFYGNLDRVLAEGGMLELMDVTVDSSAVGIFKPDPRIFLTALAALGLSSRPDEVAMVGDSPDNDCESARRAGMKAIWLCSPPDRAARRDFSDFADLKINALEELLKLQ